MRYKDAKRLHNEDEVIIKASGCLQYVVDVDIHEKDVFVRCDDGGLYHHTDIR